MEVVLQEFLAVALKAVISGLGILIGKLMLHLINSSKSQYVRALAIQAVLFAEDKFGADTEKGKEKMELAILFLMDKVKMDRDTAEATIRAAYQGIFIPFQGQQLS